MAFLKKFLTLSYLVLFSGTLLFSQASSVNGVHSSLLQSPEQPYLHFKRYFSDEIILSHRLRRLGPESRMDNINHAKNLAEVAEEVGPMLSSGNKSTYDLLRGIGGFKRGFVVQEDQLLRLNVLGNRDSLYEQMNVKQRTPSAKEFLKQVPPGVFQMFKGLGPLADMIFKNMPGGRDTRTLTVGGEACLMKLLANPTNDKADLLRRQSLMENLLLKEENLEAAQGICNEISNAEDGLCAILDDEALQKTFSDHYLSPNYLGSSWMSPVLMGQRLFRTVTSNASQPLNMAKQAAISSLFSGLVLTPPSTVVGGPMGQVLGSYGKQLAQTFLSEETKVLKPTLDGLGVGAIPELINKNYGRAGILALNPVILAGFRPAFSLMYEGAFADQVFASSDTLAGYVGMVVGSNPVSNLMSHKNEYWSTEIGVAEAKIIKSLEQIMNLKDTWIALKGFSTVSAADALVVDGFFVELEKALSSSFLLRTNNLVQLFWKHMMLPGDQNPLRLFLKRVYELDAFCAYAQYLKNLKDKGFSCCKVNFVDGNDPVIKFEGAYHPLMVTSGAKVVPNDVTFDKNMRSMFLVAPNSSGKSGLVEMILSNVLAAQTMGWVWGDKAEMTIFDETPFYKKVDEDMEAGVSTGQAQVACIAQITGDIRKKATLGKKILFIGDEVASGLSREGAEKVLFAKDGLFETLDNSPTVCSIIISHFNLQKKVEGLKSFQPFHMDVEESGNLGKFSPLYKLQGGVGFWLSNKKEDLEKRERYITWYLKKLKQKKQDALLELQKERLMKQFGFDVGYQIYSNVQQQVPEEFQSAAIENLLAQNKEGGKGVGVEETVAFENYPYLMNQPGCKEAATIFNGQFDRESIISLPHAELMGLIGEGRSLFSEIGGINGEGLQTASGRLELFKWLSSPTSSSATINQRQTLIEYLLAHPNERKNLKELCGRFASAAEKQVGATIDQARMNSMLFVGVGAGMVNLPQVIEPYVKKTQDKFPINPTDSRVTRGVAQLVNGTADKVVRPLARRVGDFARDDVHAIMATKYAMMGAGIGATLAMTALVNLVAVPFRTSFGVVADLASKRITVTQGLRRLVSETAWSLVPRVPSKAFAKQFFGQLTGVAAYQAFKRGDRAGGTLSLLRTFGAYGLGYLTYRSFVNQYESSVLGRAEKPIVMCVDGLNEAIKVHASIKNSLGALGAHLTIPANFVNDITAACEGNIFTRSARKVNALSELAGAKRLAHVFIKAFKDNKDPNAKNLAGIADARPVQQLFENVAFVDACCAYADYIELIRSQGIPVCKATFVGGDEACVKVDGAVHPLIAAYRDYDMQNIVPNDFDLSGKSRNAVLTAHNSSGKSVAIQTAANAMLSAQISGYTMGTNYVGTLVDGFSIYKKIDEEMGKRLSTGDAQNLNIMGLDAYIKKAAESKAKLFLVLDEPGSGTPNRVAEGILLDKKVVGLFNTMNQSKNVISCVATHFKFDLSSLNSFSRYHMQVDHALDDEGIYTFTRRYKVLPGSGIWLSEKPEDKKVVDAYMDVYLDSIIAGVSDQ
ncbi:TPA: hypothetical protein DDZ86_02215 [Candidatus Dependentiae bacterium]|nr:MAG: mismatch repair protein MutS protein [candidate division TM6 bacterium GW2011_GWF2_43_87]HBL98433.1 hypothetical protein [Candidatus Dependentiae bacterium]